ncbi:MAG: LacI family DNA-binding transcriptional regulator [Ktedonobacterales bacterium]|nr:LacI family DNA-binding transcriptional regulator [Ktedonobacterales bacterium]
MTSDAKDTRRKGTAGTHRRPTTYDVAKQAGVAQSTVSYVLNDVRTVTIPQETRDRVLEAARTLGYRPNAAAASLRMGRTNTIGLISDEIATTPFAGKIIKGAQDYAWEQGKILMIINTDGDADIAAAAITLLLERRVDGIIYAAMHHQEVLLPTTLRETPAILLDCFVADRSLPSVTPDESGGGYTATQTLSAHGHRRIGFINLQPDLPAAVGRLAGYHAALREAGIALDPALVRHGNSRADSGYALTRELMQLTAPPTAIFCGNDNIAMGAYDALRELGLAIPNDVAVIGFDNQEIIAAYLRPALTTLELPHYAMGQWAVRYLLDHTEHSADEAVPQVVLPCPLVMRDSL